MKLKELAVVNYGNIKKAKLDLDYQGITFIFGKNKDASPGATNGAGKSQFFTALPELVFGKPPSGNDGHKHKDAKIRLTFEDNNKTYQFTKEYGKSKKFVVTKDGENLNVRTLDYAQKKLQAFFGRSEEDFYTRIYIDSLLPHPLISGSAAQKQAFFVSMFHLENIDNIRKLLLAELSTVQKTAASYREVKVLFDEAKSQLTTTAEEREELSNRINKLREKRDRLLEESSEAQRVKELLAFERDNEKLLSRFFKLSSVSTFEEDRKALLLERKVLREQREAAIEWKAYNKARVAYDRALASFQKELDALGLTEDLKLVAKYSKKYEELQEKSSLLSREIALLQDQVVKVSRVEEAKYDVKTCELRVYKLKEELEHVHEFKSGKCPTCGSSVEARPVKEVKRDLAKWKDRLAKAQAYEDYKEACKKNKEIQGQLKEKTDELEETDRLKKKYKKYKEAEKLLDKQPEKPTKPDVPKVESEDIEEKLESVLKKLEVLNAIEPVIERVRDLKKLTTEDRERAKVYESVNEKLRSYNEKLTELEALKVSQDEALKNLQRLKQRVITLKKQAADEPILKSLVKAYSNKGMKKLMIQRYASLLQSQVNKFAKYTFSENFTFEFKYDTRLQILVHRKYGKKVLTSDVRRLSGAEKRMFILLLVVACYTMTPVRFRSNVLILDELEANMGPEAIQNFLKVLPILNKIIPHIIVITPNPDLDVPGARAFTAVKHRGVISLEKGRVKW